MLRRLARFSFRLAPVEQPFGWWSLFEDPDGNRFALVPRAVGLQRSEIGVRTAPGRRGRPAGCGYQRTEVRLVSTGSG